MDEHDEEDHDNIMAMDEEEEIHDHHDHQHEDDGDDDDEEEMDMEPTRVIIHNNNEHHEILDFWEHEPTKDEIWEVRFRSIQFLSSRTHD
jgi:hypothetical protein